MAELLIRKFNEYNEESYYSKLDDSMDRVLDTYISIRSNTSMDETEKAEAARECSGQISGIMSTSGMNGDNDLPFDLEREFFTEGELNEKKYKNFKSRVLQSRSAEELKWIFAGTTASYSKVTARELEKKNIQMDDLLPLELRKDREAGKAVSRKVSPSAYSVYVYPDGSLSSEYEGSRAGFSFDRTKDKWGVPWESGYDPNIEISKNGWDAGFNNEGVWEPFTTATSGTGSATTEGKTASPLLSFDPRLQDDLEFIYVLPVEEDEGILGDSEGLLVNEQEEQFFSVKGELRAARKTDPVNTTARLNRHMEKMGIRKLRTVIVPDISEKTVSAYKKALGNRITGKTVFRTAADSLIHTEMAQLRNSMAGDRASAEIVRRVRVLQSKGIKGGDLYGSLEHESVAPVIERELQVFGGEKDLNTFINMPGISETLDGDMVSYIKQLEIPEDKKEPMSKAVQNLVYNYKELFQHTDITPVEIVSIIYETIVKGNTAKASKIRITGESTLADFIRQQMPGSKKTVVPAFHSVRKLEKAPDLFSEEGFAEWQNNAPAFLSSEMVFQVREVLQKVQASEEEMKDISMTLVSAFEEYDQVRESTGITPAEFTTEVVSVVRGKKADTGARPAGVAAKRVLFNKSLDRLVIEASLGTKLTETIQKRELFTRIDDDIVVKVELNETAEGSADVEDDLVFATDPGAAEPVSADSEAAYPVTTDPVAAEKRILAEIRAAAEEAGITLTPEQVTRLVEQYRPGYDSKVSAALRRIRPEYSSESVVKVNMPDVTGQSDTGWKLRTRRSHLDKKGTQAYYEIKFTDKARKAIPARGRRLIEVLVASGLGGKIDFESLVKEITATQPGAAFQPGMRYKAAGMPGEESGTEVIFNREKIIQEDAPGVEDNEAPGRTGARPDSGYNAKPVKARKHQAGHDMPGQQSGAVTDRMYQDNEDEGIDQARQMDGQEVDPEAIRMQRINENYHADKAMLAKSGTKDAASGGSGAASGGGNGNKIKKASQELFEEFIDKITS